MSDPKKKYPGLDGFEGAVEVEGEAMGFEGPVTVEPETPAPRPAPAPTPKRPEPSQLEALRRGITNGGTMGLADEFSAFIQTALPGGSPWEGQRATGRGFNAPVDQRSEYEVARDQERDADRAAEQAHPKTYMGGQIAGGVAASAVPFLKVAPAATLAGRAAQGMKVGAGYGAAYGFGDSEGEHSSDVAMDTLGGGVVGAVTGPLAGEAIHQVSRLPKAVKDYVLKKTGRTPEAKELAAYGDRLPVAKEMTDPSDAGKSLRAQAARGADPQVVEQYARDLDDKLTRLWKNADLVKWEEDIGKKGELVTKLIKRDGVDPDEVIRRADDMAQRLEIQLHDLYGYVSPGTTDHNIITKVLKEVAEYAHGTPSMAKRRDLASVTPHDVAGDKFLALDQVKREMQKALDGARSRGDSLIIEEVDTLAEGLREYLQNPAIWGEGSAALQQIRNQGWRERLLMKTRKGDPNRVLLSDASYEPSMDKYRPGMKGDPASLVSLVQNADQFASSDGIRALREYVRREAELLEKLTNHVDPDPDLVRRAVESRQLAAEIDQLITQRTEEAIAARKLDSIGPPSVPPPAGPGPLRKGLEYVPVVGPIARIDRTLRERVGAQQDVPQLQEQARMMQHLERVLGIDPKNPYAKEALDRMFGSSNGQPSPYLPLLRGGALPVATEEANEQRRNLLGR